MEAQRRAQGGLWLLSFDIAKCYDSVPWWGVFGVLRTVGMDVGVVAAFEAFYRGLRRRFRYGQWEGAEWKAMNGLAQGCPASPDLLNVLMEAFHRWAWGQGVGVTLAGRRVPSLGYADDVVLLASTAGEAEWLAAGYLQWCGLLQLRVNVEKTQVWTLSGDGQPLMVGGRAVLPRATFRFGGIEVGADATAVAKAHLGPRMEKAQQTTARI